MILAKIGITGEIKRICKNFVCNYDINDVTLVHTCASDVTQNLIEPMDIHAARPLDAVKIITLPRIHDPRGNLTFAESGAQIPFSLNRAYWIYDVPAGEERGGHSHHEMWQLLIAVGGGFNVNVCDGENWRTFTLNRPYEGLIIPPGIWRTLDNFSSGGVCLSLVSTHYEEADYIRDFEDFKKTCRQ